LEFSGAGDNVYGFGFQVELQLFAGHLARNVLWMLQQEKAPPYVQHFFDLLTTGLQQIATSVALIVQVASVDGLHGISLVGNCNQILFGSNLNYTATYNPLALVALCQENFQRRTRQGHRSIPESFLFRGNTSTGKGLIGLVIASNRCHLNAPFQFY